MRRAHALELDKNGSRLALPRSERAQHGADRARPVFMRKPPRADRRQNLKQDPDDRFQSQFDGEVGPRRFLQRLAQVFAQARAGRLADRRVGARHSRHERSPGRVLKRLYDEGVAPERDPEQRVARGGAYRLDELVERGDEIVGDGDGERVHVVEMRVERSLRDSRLVNEIVDGDGGQRARREQRARRRHQLRAGAGAFLLADLRPTLEIDRRHPTRLRRPC